MRLDPPVVVLADGAFPTHDWPLATLREAGTLICCDGAANQMLGQPRQPDVVLGDLDSLNEQAYAELGDRLINLSSQQSNDLEKALKWTAEQGVREVTVLGATGLRDDHAFGNLLMLWTDFELDITLLTDTGTFTVVRASREYASFTGQVVALFPETTHIRITTTGLAYALQDQPLSAHHKGVSNRSLGDTFSIQVMGGAVVIYQGYPV
ncbi:MAG: thiamine diphosphokinase [Candidatus Marinimicrobia bacterium]|nr:thiamine diphosphokinase [Candidatus Neomarinimicrobiota bacterium]